VRALSESEERFGSLVNNSPDAIFLADPETGIIPDANPTASTMMAMPREKIIGMHQSQLHPPSTGEFSKNAFPEHIQQNITNIPVQPIENVVIGSEGTETPVEVVSRIITLNDRPVLMGVFRDITVRKRAEEAIREKLYIIESASSAIATADLEGHMTYGNPAFMRMWGFNNPDEFLGKHFSEFWIIEDKYEKIMHALWNEGWWVDEIKAVRTDGSLFDVQVSAAMVYDNAGKPVSMMSTSTDITDRVVSEERNTRMGRILDTSLNEIYIFDSETFRFIQVNRGAQKNLGYSMDELKEMAPLDFKPEFTAASFEKSSSLFVTEKRPKSEG